MGCDEATASRRSRQGRSDSRLRSATLSGRRSRAQVRSTCGMVSSICTVHRLGLPSPNRFSFWGQRCLMNQTPCWSESKTMPCAQSYWSMSIGSEGNASSGWCLSHICRSECGCPITPFGVGRPGSTGPLPFQRAILVGIYLFYAGAKTTARRQRVDLAPDGLGKAEHRGVGRDSQPHDRHSPYISGNMRSHVHSLR